MKGKQEIWEKGIKEGIKEQSVSEDRQVTELKKFFNVNGSCNPQIHYMIEMLERI